MTKDLASTEVCVRFFSVILLLVSHSYEGPQIGDEVEVSSDSVPIELHRGQWHDLMVPHFSRYFVHLPVFIFSKVRLAQLDS